MVTINEIRDLENSRRDEIRDELKPRIYDYVCSIGWADNPYKPFACPICGKGTRTPNTSIDPTTYRIKSFSCGCLEGADLFDIIEMEEPTVNNTFEALEYACNLYSYSLSAGIDPGDAAPVTPKPRRFAQQPELDQPEPPAIEWQNRARSFVSTCESNLWSSVGEYARRYLMEKRKLTEKTLRDFHIGYNPRNLYRDSEFIAPAGITIPTIIGSDLYRVKIRTDRGNQKYMQYKGSVSCCPFNEYDLLHEVDVVIVEGEIDVMTIYQAGNCGAVTFGSATSIPSAVTWREWLKNPDRICICFDNDDSGRKGSIAMYSEILRLEKIRPVRASSVYIKQLPKPDDSDKMDWNDFYTAGGDVSGLLDKFFPLGLKRNEYVS